MIPLIVDSAVVVGFDLAGEDLHWWDKWMERQSRSSNIRFILIKVEIFSSKYQKAPKEHPKCARES